MWTHPDVGRAQGHCVGKLSRGSKRNLAGILSKVPQNINEGFHPMLRSHCCLFSCPVPHKPYWGLRKRHYPWLLNSRVTGRHEKEQFSVLRAL